MVWGGRRAQFARERGSEGSQRQSGSIPGEADYQKKERVGQSSSKTRAGTGQRHAEPRSARRTQESLALGMTKNHPAECDSELGLKHCG